MGSLKSGLLAIALTSLGGAAAVVGCSADGGGAGIADTTTDQTIPPAPADPPNVGKLPPSNGSGDSGAPVDAGRDASKRDGGGPKPEAGVDAGPPPPVPGTVCAALNTIAMKPCGKCGTTGAVCLDDGTGTGKGTWSDYGACGDEKGSCMPGETVTEDCGNCGKQVKTCNQFCAFSTSACAGQPMNSCKPATTEYSTAGCVTPQTYRNRTCGATCTWSNFTAACDAPVNDLKLDIGTSVAALTSKTITLTAARVLSRLSAFSLCPQVSAPTAGNFPYQYVEIHNPSATEAAKVTVYASAAPGGFVIDTMMVGYGGSVQPVDEPARLACRDGANDQSSSADLPLTGNLDFSILKGIAIPAGGSILIYIASYYEVGSTDFDGNPRVVTGDLNINTKVETLN